MKLIPTSEAAKEIESPTTRIALSGLLILVVIVAYWSSLNAPLVFDSKKLETDEAYTRPVPLWRAISGSRSLVAWSFAVQYQATGGSVRSYALVNLAIHLCAALLLFGIARRSFLLASMPSALRDQASGWAFAVAALWAVHPLTTQAVTYTIQRHESLMALFFLLTIYGVLRGSQSKVPIVWYVVAIVSSFLGVSCKSVMVTAPLVTLLFDYAIITRSWAKTIRQRLLVYVALFAAGAWGIFLERGVFNPTSTHTIGLGLNTVSPWEYFRTQPQVLLHYISLIFWPQQLCIDYRWPIEDSSLAIYGPGLIVVGLLVLCVSMLVKRPPLGFLGLSFFLILAPTSSFIPIVDLAFEHRLYLPMAAIIALAVVAIYFITEKYLDDPRARLLLRVGLLSLAIIALTLRTVVRNLDYRQPVRLWTKVIEVNPQNARAYNNLGTLAAQRGDVDEAIRLHQQALQIDDSFAAHVSLSALYQSKGQWDPAIDHAQRAIAILPHEPVGYFNLGVGYEGKNQLEDAIEQYRHAIQRNDRYALAHNNLALLLSRRGDHRAAEQHFHKAIAANPNFNTAIVNLGEFYRSRGDWNRAIDTYRQALKVNSQYAPTHLFLGQALAKRNDTIDAIISMRKAIELSPEWPEPKLQLAWLLATTPDAAVRNPEEALALASAAIPNSSQATPDEVDVLAAAYAANGDFEQAISLIERAIEGRPNDSGLQQRLEAYRNHEATFEHNE